MSRRLNISNPAKLNELLATLGVTLDPDKIWPRYNIAPRTALWACYQEFANFKLSPVEWAMVPPWADNDRTRAPHDIARAETVWERAAFKNLIRRYRAIVPVNGFYVWPGKESVGQPWHVTSATESALALAAIYQFNADGIMQICLLTLPESGALDGRCKRVPVVVPLHSLRDWLGDASRDDVDAQLQAPTSDSLIATRVSKAVNDLDFESPECIVAVH